MRESLEVERGQLVQAKQSCDFARQELIEARAQLQAALEASLL